jgi:hypothetical protein
MNFRLFGCGKFKYLAIEKFDRQLNPRELDFYRKHREVCFPCMRYEQQGTNAMNLLTAASIEPEISENFDERVLRMLRTPQRRFEFRNFAPVLAGAAIAGLALIATLQLVTGSSISLWTPNGRPTPAFRYNDKEQAATQPNLILPPELTKS